MKNIPSGCSHHTTERSSGLMDGENYFVLIWQGKEWGSLLHSSERRDAKILKACFFELLSSIKAVIVNPMKRSLSLQPIHSYYKIIHFLHSRCWRPSLKITNKRKKIITQLTGSVKTFQMRAIKPWNTVTFLVRCTFVMPSRCTLYDRTVVR